MVFPTKLTPNVGINLLGSTSVLIGIIISSYTFYTTRYRTWIVIRSFDTDPGANGSNSCGTLHAYNTYRCFELPCILLLLHEKRGTGLAYLGHGWLLWVYTARQRFNKTKINSSIKRSRAYKYHRVIFFKVFRFVVFGMFRYANWKNVTFSLKTTLNYNFFCVFKNFFYFYAFGLCRYTFGIIEHHLSNVN